MHTLNTGFEWYVYKTRRGIASNEQALTIVDLALLSKGRELLHDTAERAAEWFAT